MKPAQIDWQAFNNEDWAGAIGIQFSDGTAFDWSQYGAIEMQVKVDPLQPEAELTLSLGSGLTVRGDDTSTLDFAMPMSAIADLLGTYVYDVVGTHDGDTTLVVRGSINVSQGVTR
jgi:hypothetical protein